MRQHLAGTVHRQILVDAQRVPCGVTAGNVEGVEQLTAFGRRSRRHLGGEDLFDLDAFEGAHHTQPCGHLLGKRFQ